MYIIYVSSVNPSTICLLICLSITCLSTTYLPTHLLSSQVATRPWKRAVNRVSGRVWAGVRCYFLPWDCSFTDGEICEQHAKGACGKPQRRGWNCHRASPPLWNRDSLFSSVENNAVMFLSHLRLKHVPALPICFCLFPWPSHFSLHCPGSIFLGVCEPSPITPPFAAEKESSFHLASPSSSTWWTPTGITEQKMLVSPSVQVAFQPVHTVRGGRLGKPEHSWEKCCCRGNWGPNWWETVPRR
jgi:hypothetical protein